jgi:hypothetical protein
MTKWHTIILVLALSLIGCGAVTSQEMNTSVAPITPKATSSGTAIASLNPDTATAAVEGLPFPEANIAKSLLLSEGSSAKCELPCWHHLVIGVSTKQDIEVALGETFKSGDSLDFFPPPTFGGGFPGRLLVGGTLVGGYYWYIETPDRLGSYFLFAYVDEKTGNLLGIQEVMDSFETYDLPLLKDIVISLGTPTWVYGGRSGSTYSIRLYYPEGISADIVILMRPDDLTTVTHLVCLSDKPLSVSIRLVHPYTEVGEGEDSLLHMAWGRPEHPAPHIDETLGKSIKEFMDSLHSENPCIEIP